MASTAVFRFKVQCKATVKAHGVFPSSRSRFCVFTNISTSLSGGDSVAIVTPFAQVRMVPLEIQFSMLDKAWARNVIFWATRYGGENWVIRGASTYPTRDFVTWFLNVRSQPALCTLSNRAFYGEDIPSNHSCLSYLCTRYRLSISASPFRRCAYSDCVSIADL